MICLLYLKKKIQKIIYRNFIPDVPYFLNLDIKEYLNLILKENKKWNGFQYPPLITKQISVSCFVENGVKTQLDILFEKYCVNLYNKDNKNEH